MLEIGIKHEIKIILKPIYNATLANHKTRRKFDLKKKKLLFEMILLEMKDSRVQNLNQIGLRN